MPTMRICREGGKRPSQWSPSIPIPDLKYPVFCMKSLAVLACMMVDDETNNKLLIWHRSSSATNDRIRRSPNTSGAGDICHYLRLIPYISRQTLMPRQKLVLVTSQLLLTLIVSRKHQMRLSRYRHFVFIPTVNPTDFSTAWRNDYGWKRHLS